MYAVLVTIFTFAQIDLHPFHLSVCDIEHNAETKALNITHRIFLDDLEVAVNEKFETQMDLLNTNDKSLRDRMVAEYVLAHFEVTVNEEVRKADYLGSEIEDGVMYCYMEIKDVESIYKIQVTNSTLQDVFDDQVNLVHVKYRDKTRSLKLERSSGMGEINYSEN